MKAVTWCGKHTVKVENVPDPKILNPRDAIVRITSTCICGSDLHLYDGYIPTMRKGDILGHEFMGEVVEVGARVAADDEPERHRASRVVGHPSPCREGPALAARARHRYELGARQGDGEQHHGGNAKDDIVDEQSKESFPASDSPAKY